MSVAAVGGAQKLLFVSVATYELGKRHGAEGAAREFTRQCEQPTKSDLPAARMVARLRTLGNVGLYHMFGSTLAKMRSRAAHAALQSKADFWIMIDDDVETDVRTLVSLLALAGDADAPRVAVLPCLLRGTSDEQRVVNVKWESSLLLAGSMGTARPIEHAGTGMMVITRAGLQQVFERAGRELPVWRDDDGVAKLPLFHQLFEPNDDGTSKWFGEDLSFCRRVRRSGVEIFGLTKGYSWHDGNQLDLADVR
jgi:hypothetical protein